jgi:hypothetical protein
LKSTDLPAAVALSEASGWVSTPTSGTFWKYVPFSPGRFGAGKLELGGDILGGEVAPANSHAAAFQKIARKEAVMRANTLRGNAGVLRPQGRKGNHRYPDRFKHDS